MGGGCLREVVARRELTVFPAKYFALISHQTLPTPPLTGKGRFPVLLKNILIAGHIYLIKKYLYISAQQCTGR